jgi:hypothetical protein
VSAEHAYAASVAPLSDARLAVADAWAPVPGASFNVSVPTRGTYLLLYLLHVKPDAAPNPSALLQRDVVSARISVDGVGLTDGSSYFSTTTRTYGSGSLAGGATAELEEGSHAVTLEWYKAAPPPPPAPGDGTPAPPPSASPNWSSQPSFLDGYVMARSLVVLAERMPIARTPLSLGTAVYGEDSPAPPAAGRPASWSAVRDGAISLTLHTEAYVVASYSLNLARYGVPTFDATTWEGVGSLEARIVVDGTPRGASTATLGGEVALQSVAAGSALLHLAAGSHSVVLQWRAVGADPGAWAAFKRDADVNAGGNIMYVLANAYNTAPVARLPADGGDGSSGDEGSVGGGEGEGGGAFPDADAPPPLARATEDTVLRLQGLRVTDRDVALEPDIEVAVDLAVSHGSLSLGWGTPDAWTGAYEGGMGEADAAVAALLPHLLLLAGTNATGGAHISLQGRLPVVNEAIGRLRYMPSPHFNGADRLQFNVSDLGNVGAGGPLAHAAVLPILVAAVNDAPVLTLPPAPLETAEDTPLTIIGISVADADAGDAPPTWLEEDFFTGGAGTAVAADAYAAEVTLSVLAGTLSLSPAEGVAILEPEWAAGSEGEVSGAALAGVRAPALRVRGSLAALNAALAAVTYTPSPDSNGLRVREELAVSVDDLGHFSPVMPTGNAGGGAMATALLPISVRPVNDAPSLQPPSPRRLLIPGLRVAGVGSGANATLQRVRVTLAVASGMAGLTLPPTALPADVALLHPAVPAGGAPAQAPLRRLVLEGAVASINRVVSTLTYERAAAWDGGDAVEVTVQALAAAGAGAAGLPAPSVTSIELFLAASRGRGDAVVPSVPAVLAAAPASGPREGGTVVTVTLGGAQAALAAGAPLFCAFGAAALAPATLLPAAAVDGGGGAAPLLLVRCVAPPAALAGSVRVRVTDNATWASPAGAAFFHYPPAPVTAVQPSLAFPASRGPFRVTTPARTIPAPDAACRFTAGRAARPSPPACCCRAAAASCAVHPSGRRRLRRRCPMPPRALS